MEQPVLPPDLPPPGPTKPKTWVIVLVIFVVLCCCLFGVIGLAIAFGPEILNSFGVLLLPAMAGML